jgi:hypothetical protein
MIGRKSKIHTYGLSNEITELQVRGHTITEITDIIKKRHPEIDIHRSSVGRFLRGDTKRLMPPDPTSIEEAFNNMVLDFIFGLDRLENISHQDRKAITKYIRSKSTVFSKKLHQYVMNVTCVGGDQLSSTWFNAFIISMSEVLCNECRNKLSDLAEAELNRRGISDDIAQ